MLINNIQSLIKGYVDTKSVSNQRNEVKTKNVAKDEVVLSSQAQNFHEVLQKAKTSSVIRSEKIDALSMQISQGTYSVDSRVLAEKMLNTRW